MKLKLTDVQMMILDNLQDDYENTKQLWTMIGREGGHSVEEFRAALKDLVKDGYIRCYEPTNTELVEVKEPDLNRVEEYWFDLSEKGRVEAEVPSPQRLR